jgi:tellurite resistance protein TehA-like permease
MIALMAVGAVIIAAMAVIVILNFSSLSLTSSLILIAVGLLVLFMIMGVLIAFMRGANSKK